jgi:hypothetical protein
MRGFSLIRTTTEVGPIKNIAITIPYLKYRKWKYINLIRQEIELRQV